MWHCGRGVINRNRRSKLGINNIILKAFSACTRRLLQGQELAKLKIQGGME